MRRIKYYFRANRFCWSMTISNSVCITGFVPIIRTRFRDIYTPGWRALIDRHTSSHLYTEIKTAFHMSPYIILLQFKIWEYTCNINIIIL